MASKYWCDECGKDIRGKLDEDGIYHNDGFDCPGGDHSYCSDSCYNKSGCAEYFER